METKEGKSGSPIQGNQNSLKSYHALLLRLNLKGMKSGKIVKLEAPRIHLSTWTATVLGETIRGGYFGTLEFI